MKNIISYISRYAALSIFAVLILCGSSLYAKEKIYIYAAASTKEVVQRPYRQL